MTQDIVERLQRAAKIHAAMNAMPLEETQDWKDADEITALRAERDEATAQLALCAGIREVPGPYANLPARARDMLEVVDAATEWAEDVGSSGYKPRIYPRLYEAVAKLNARGE